MIEKYWGQMFKTFQVTERSYLIPGFPEKLISADFEKNNLLGDLGSQVAAQSFKLCLFPPVTQKIGMAKVEKLNVAVTRNEFWDYQKLCNLPNYSFMMRFLKFLVEERKEYYHFYFQEQHQIIASVLAGCTPTSVCLLNLSVDPKMRNRGISHELVKCVQEHFSRPCFYWTKHPWFTLGANEVLDYHLVQR